MLETVSDQVYQDLANARRIRAVACGRGRGALDAHAQSLALGDGPHHVARFRHKGRRREIDRIDAQPAVLDSRQVKHLVDDIEQCLAGVVDDLELGARAPVGQTGSQQLRRTDDRMHRRSDLVADPGKKLGFRRASLLGNLLGAGKLGRALQCAMTALGCASLPLSLCGRATGTRQLGLRSLKSG